MPFVSNLNVADGEPLLYPHLERLLAAGRKAGCTLRLVTIGALLDADRLEMLFGFGLKKLKFSLDAAKPATYRKIRGGDLSRVLRNLRRAVGVRRALGVSSPHFEVGFVAIRSNIAELPTFVPTFVGMAGDLGVDVIHVSYMVVHHADVYEESLYHEQERSDEIMPAAARIARETGVVLNLPPLFGARAAVVETDAFRSARETCFEPWRNMFLRPNGGVSMCCGGGANCGDLAGGSFTEMWNHPARVNARTRVNTDNPPKPCRRCFTVKQNPNRLDTHFSGKAEQDRWKAGRELDSGASSSHVAA